MTARKRGKAVSIRRVYHAPEQMRAAFLAGQGHSGGEIAGILGGTTGPKIRAMLRKCGIKMQRKAGAEELVTIRWSRRDHSAFVLIADRHEMDAADLAAELLRALAAEPVLLLNLLDREDGE